MKIRIAVLVAVATLIGFFSLTTDVVTQVGQHFATGIVTNGADIVFSPNSSEAMRAEAGGDVGIGITNPTVLLHVEQATGGDMVRIGTLTSGDPTIVIASADGATNAARITGVGVSSQTELAFLTGGSERMRIDGAGNVGIGTANPLSLLHLDNPGGIATIRLESSGDTYLIEGQSGHFEINDNITAAQFVLNGGEVGIGIATPDGTLHVHSATAGSVVADSAFDNLVVEAGVAGGISILGPDNVAMGLAFGSPTTPLGASLRWQQSTGALEISTELAGAILTFQTDTGAEAMRIDSGGDVGINDTNPERPLHVNDVMRLEPRATLPASPAAGDIYVDSTPSPDELCFYDGTGWQGISSGTDANCA